MFSHNVKNTAFAGVRAAMAGIKASPDQVRAVISKAMGFERITPEEFMLLLTDTAMELGEELRSAAHHVTLQRHGRTMRFYAPLYVSNECNNSCVYCGFKSANDIKRMTLSIDEVMREASIIKQMGIEHLLVVSGECIRTVGLDYLAQVAKALSGSFSAVSIEVAPLGTKEYSELFGAGIEGVTCYQETYDPVRYSEYHPAGPKRDMERRLDTLDRAGEAGMRYLGIGALLGLNDVRTETYFLALHARHLEKRYWRSSVSVSFPRMRPSESGFQPPFPVSDQELLHVISALRLFLPDSNLVLSTRESAEFRDRAVLYGINQMSAGSRTNPLGHSQEHSGAGKQFEIADPRTPGEMANSLSGAGYDPVFKDWDRGFRQ